jgi:transposase
MRSAVSKSHRYEPDINPSYRDLAEHYGVAVVPARARKPRDKAKAWIWCYPTSQACGAWPAEM